MQLGLAIGQSLQLVEHGSDVARHADLIGLGVVGLGPRFLQLVLQLGAFFNQPRLIGLDELQLGGMAARVRTTSVAIRSRTMLQLP